MATNATITIGKQAIGSVSPYIFGANLEHVGREIYGGVWDVAKDTLSADAVNKARDLAPTLIRYPGSVFCSQYDWRDGVGPAPRKPYERTVWNDFAQALVPHHPDLETFSKQVGLPEANRFGTDEFLRFCIEVGAEPMLAANPHLGPKVAAEWVRYCNVDRKAPRPVKYWSVGYEPWAPYEPGPTFESAEEYGALLLEFIEAMRAEDPDIRFLAPGVAWPDFGETLTDPNDPLLGRIASYTRSWNVDLLKIVGDKVESISMHYTWPGVLGRMLGDSMAEMLQMAIGGDGMGDLLDKTLGPIDAANTGGRRIGVELREWGWQVHAEEFLGTNHRRGHALLTAGCFNRMLERADRLKFAMTSHLVNTLSSIQIDDRGRSFVTAIYLITQLYRTTCRSTSYPVDVKSNDFLVPPLEDLERAMHLMEGVGGTHAGDSLRRPMLDAAATADDSGTTVYIGNRSPDTELTVVVQGVANGDAGRFAAVDSASPFTQNTFEKPNELYISRVDVRRQSDGSFHVVVPPLTAGALIVDRRP